MENQQPTGRAENSQEKIYKHTKKVFIGDAILLPLWGLGLVTGFIHFLKYASESFSIDNRHVKLKTGILSNNEIEVPFSKINSISVKQGLLGKILNYGTVVIFTGNDVSGIAFDRLDSPSEIKMAIQGKMHA